MPIRRADGSLAGERAAAYGCTGSPFTAPSRTILAERSRPNNPGYPPAIAALSRPCHRAVTPPS